MTPRGSRCPRMWPARPGTGPLLVTFILLAAAPASPQHDFPSAGRQKANVPPDFLSQAGRSVRETLEAWIGPETWSLVAETLTQVLWAISSAISVAFFALSGISAQLLNALGLNGDYLTEGLQLSPGQVQTFLLWGAGALVAYWLLSLLLGLVLAVLGRILWGLKLALFLAGFVAVVRTVPEPSARAVALLGLLTLYALLGRLSGGGASGAARLEAKVRGLERQLEELRWRQRKATKASRNAEE
ncbi:transmembrane protein 109 [Tachyglossus aculeatus]|uniref:transmembrane protein 109 n=1 Tax=Tachyglossus aculeatus TaxID=9261 RepID=UPI0018F71FF8|nr:transmembrane protein 109 [Tachyglossus aculeatus]